MVLTMAQRLERLKVRLEELFWWRERESIAIEGWTCNGAPIEPGAPWPGREGLFEFAASVTAPGHWPLAETRLYLDLGGESLVALNHAGGEAIRFGVDPYHREFPVPAQAFSIASESVARLPFGEPVRRPHLNAARLSWIDLPVHQLHLRLRQVAEACTHLGDHEVVPHLVAAAEQALRTLDWPSATAEYVARFAPQAGQQKIWQLPDLVPDPAGLTETQRQSVMDADATLIATLQSLQQRFPPQGQIALTGHAHIDLAWLWPYAETRRKARRTFHTALALIEGSNQHLAESGFRFNQSTAHYYAQIEEDDPALFRKIAAAVRAGAWETIGGMWVEPDTNMPTGESLVRQVLYGQRYFERQFGRRHTVCWLPDCFGFSAALPQILRQGGITSFFTIKVNWSETNRFPADLFWWEGLDGSRVLAHTFDNPVGGYNGAVSPEALLATWRNFRGKTMHEETLLAVGYGDGGGGVTPEFIERALQLRDFPALPAARWGRVADFYDRAHQQAQAVELPIWQGEIYLELHRATLTTQSAVKKLHRQAERALITAETVGSLAALLGAELPTSLEPVWRVVLKNEFHDILPGSSIAEVYEDAGRELGEAIAAGRAEQEAALDRVVAQLPKGTVEDALVVVNPSLSARPLRAQVEGKSLATADVVPPLAVAVLDRRQLQPIAGLEVDAGCLENRHLRVQIAADGTIASLVHKPTGREALAGRGNQLWVYPQDKPRNWDAWDIEEDYVAKGIELTEVESIEVTESGPHRAAVRVVKRFRDSSISQTYALSANGFRLDVETEIHWHDRHCLLRTLTPVDIRASHATFEHAHGVVRRTTHDNTSWDQAQFEVPGHRFVDMSEPGFGVALLNDAKYGHSAKGNVLGLSLVRSPLYPDPLADEGRQTFTYALLPHAGDWHAGGVREEAEDLNQPLLVTAASGLATGVTQPLRTSGIDSALSGFKPAEDGKSLIFRVYEPAGRRGDLALTLPAGWREGGTVSILEEPMQRPEGPALLPFELRSWRLVRG
ncbi:MAG TPA: glycoside hydrolase family 38 C-terminal domain-containing protein [Devosiaceae bacterium]|jgi:alpha-mannosidase|nr:glycoside hydrolase family 38 C-terminal domain-containing protein [Devosiaceae bacterium]